MTQAIYHLANAIAALKLAFDATGDGILADRIHDAEVATHRALRQLAENWLASPYNAEEQKIQAVMKNVDVGLADVHQRIDAVLAQMNKE